MTDAPDRWERIRALFDAAIDHPPERRRSVVEEMTDEPELRAEVLALLDSHESGGRVDDIAGALAGDGQDGRDGPFRVPDRIGPYRILRTIGEGGMGVVFEAEQREPVRRRVAIKMMKVGMDTREVVGRFEAERQALAMMDHPGIAKVLDAGATDHGRPYFVMELVRGIPLDEFCNAGRLTTRRRVQLFIEVCAAIQHAHQKGVIHRDLKPSNILVAEDDDEALPRVIDFGIAKATGHQLTDKTVVTALGQALGTLTYMSPEQAGSSGLDVDTRTDVYALGVILYQMLIGVVPVDPAEVGAPVFVARLVEPDSTPPTPAKRLTSLSGMELEAIASARRTDVRQLRREVSRDLGWIVLKAMAKEREARYDTASALAEDLRRFLRDEPVLAHPPAAAYRIGKFVRRNLAAVTAATVAIVALGTSTVLSMRSRADAIESEQVALAEAERAEAVNGFLVELLGSADPAEDGRDVRVAEVLDRASETAAERFAGSAVAEGSVRLALGATYEGLGLYDEAERELRRAAEIYRELDDPALADVAIELGSLLVARGDFGGAREVQDEALRVRTRVHGARSTSVGEALMAIGESDFFEGDFAGAAERFRQALDIYADSLEADTEPVVYATSNLSAALDELGELEESLRLSERALEGMRALMGPDHVDVGTVSGNHALKLQALGRLEETEPFLLDALRIFRLAYGRESDRTARALNNLGAYYERVGRLDAAADALLEAVEVNTRALGADHREVASNLRNLGNVRVEQGRYEEAVELFERSLEINRTARPGHPIVSQSMASVAWATLHLGRHAEAERLLRQALEQSVDALGAEHFESATIELYLGETLRRMGRFDEAEPLLVGGYARLSEALGPDHGIVAEASEWLARYRQDVGR